MKAPIILSNFDGGIHNADLTKTISRLNKDMAYKDLSCIIITPTLGQVPIRVIKSWEELITPPNNRIVRLYADGAEVGEAYSACIEAILTNPELSKWKYICTREHDNVLPPDGLIKLLRQMEDHPEYSAISACYFTKGFNGQPQIWGDTKDHVFNFRPQLPDPKGGLIECNGIGQGFAVFRMKMFKDKNLRRPWFKTTSSKEEGAYSQDLYFWSDARKNGYRVAVDCSVKVGHYDYEGKFGEAGMIY